MRTYNARSNGQPPFIATEAFVSALNSTALSYLLSEEHQNKECLDELKKLLDYSRRLEDPRHSTYEALLELSDMVDSAVGKGAPEELARAWKSTIEHYILPRANTPKGYNSAPVSRAQGELSFDMF